MKRTVKKTLAALLALCMVMALLPTSFINVAAADPTYDLEVLHIYKDDTSLNYADIFVDNNAGDEVLVTIEPYDGYEIDELYFTTAAGDAFTELIDPMYRNPIDGVYVVIMPDTDATMHVVYRSTVHDVTINHIFGAGIYDDQDYSVVWLPQSEGEDVIFTVEDYFGYEVDEIVFTSKTEGAFVEIIDVPYSQIDNNAWMFAMPDCDVTMNIIYKDVAADVNVVYFFENGTPVQGNFYNGPTSIEAGELTYFYFDAIDNYNLKAVYATCGAGAAFVESLEVVQYGDNTYYFVAPAEDVTVYAVYENVEYAITSQNIFDDGNVDANVYYSGQDTALVGQKVYFTVGAPEGYAISEVYATCNAGGAFNESVKVEKFAGGYYFTMPAGDVTIDFVYKPSVFTVDGISYIGDEYYGTVSFGSWNVGDNVVIIPDEIDRCVVEDVIITATIGAFQEVLNYEVLGNAYIFTMPEGNVTVNITYKENLFDINVYTYVGEDGDDSWVIEGVEAGSDYTFTLVPPVGCVVDEVIAVVNAGGVFDEIIPVTHISGNTYSIDMPAKDVTLNVIYKSAYHSVTINCVDADGNLISTETEAQVAEGEIVFCNFEVDGYLLDEFFVNRAVGNFYEFYDGYTVVKDNEIALVVPDSDVVITAVFVSDEFKINYNFIEDETNIVSTGTLTGHANENFFFNANLEGYEVTEIYFVTEEGVFGAPIDYEDLGNGYYAFEMPVSDVEVAIYVAKTTVDVVLPEGDGFVINPIGDSSAVTYGGSYSFTVDFDESLDADSIVLKANGKVITPDAGVYTIENITEKVYITFEGALAPKVYSVKFNYFNGDKEVSVSNSVINGTDVVAPTDVYRYGYTFIGWFDNANGDGEAVTDFTNITADAEYFAVYEATPVAEYSFGEYIVTDSTYGATFKEISMKVVKNNAEYQDREVFVIVAAQVKDGSTVVFYVPVEVKDGEASTDVSVILSTSTFTSADMYLVYDEVDFTGSINWEDIETGIQIG